MAEKRSLINAGSMGLVLWILAGCASLSGSGSGNDETRPLSFSYQNPKAKEVSIVGSFNAWTAGADPMVKTSAGNWEGTLRLPKGTHQYMFVVDGKAWVTDPKADRTVEDGFGRVNGLLMVE